MSNWEIIKNQKCRGCQKITAVVKTHKEQKDGECLDCVIARKQKECKELKEYLKKAKQDPKGKGEYQRGLVEQKERFSEAKQLKEKHPEFKQKLEEYERLLEEVIPKEDLKEVGKTNPTNGTPGIVGGIIIGVLAIGLIGYWGYRKGKAKDSK